ncbi:MAG TPA: VWA domain-containing protein [Bryobacteraceae bacterium]|nr:VWA domain-containing protein [Bryobacteraceae bacterium]
MRYAAILILALSLAAQETRFGVGSRLVLVPVTVTDTKGGSVDDLDVADFLLFDNQQKREVAVDTIATGVAPIALVIAVQASGISTAVLEKVQNVGGMVQPLITGERGCAALLTFADKVEWQQECTNDSYALERAFWKLHPGEHKEARMLDAVDAAIDHLSKRANSRRVLLLISESRDRNSETTLEAATVRAQAADVTIYAATYSALKAAFTSKRRLSEPGRVQTPKTPAQQMGTVNGAPPSKFNPKIMPREQSVDIIAGVQELHRLNKINTTEALAEITGGATFSFTRQKGLEDAIEKLGQELHRQYVLSFVPQGAAEGYHKLEVRISRPGEFRIRARPGYWLNAEAQ